MAGRTNCALLLLAVGCFAACLGSSHAYSSQDKDTSGLLCSKSFTVVETDTVNVLPPGVSDYMNGTTYIFRNTLTLPSSYGKKDVVVGYTFGTCTIFIVVEAASTPSPYYYHNSKRGHDKKHHDSPSTSTGTSSSFSVEYCKTSYVLDKLGTIEAQGPYPDIQDNVFQNAVVGGTGAFEGANGQVAVKVLEVGSVWQHTFHLQEAPACKDTNKHY